MANEIEMMMESVEYAEFLMANCDRPICNGDMLTELMEEGYMFEEFLNTAKK